MKTTACPNLEEVRLDGLNHVTFQGVKCLLKACQNPPAPTPDATYGVRSEMQIQVLYRWPPSPCSNQPFRVISVASNSTAKCPNLFPGIYTLNLNRLAPEFNPKPFP